jgi:hypothetical protein
VTLSRAADVAEAAAVAVALAVVVVVACAAVAVHPSVEVEVHVPAAVTAAPDLAAAMPDALRRCRDRITAVGLPCRDRAADDNRSAAYPHRALAQVHGPAADRLRAPEAVPDQAAEALPIGPARVPVEAVDLAAVNSREVAVRRSAISIIS